MKNNKRNLRCRVGLTSELIALKERPGTYPSLFTANFFGISHLGLLHLGQTRGFSFPIGFHSCPQRHRAMMPGTIPIGFSSFSIECPRHNTCVTYTHRFVRSQKLLLAADSQQINLSLTTYVFVIQSICCILVTSTKDNSWQTDTGHYFGRFYLFAQSQGSPAACALF